MAPCKICPPDIPPWCSPLPCFYRGPLSVGVGVAVWRRFCVHCPVPPFTNLGSLGLGMSIAAYPPTPSPWQCDRLQRYHFAARCFSQPLCPISPLCRPSVQSLLLRPQLHCTPHHRSYPLRRHQGAPLPGAPIPRAPWSSRLTTLITGALWARRTTDLIWLTMSLSPCLAVLCNPNPPGDQPPH